MEFERVRGEFVVCLCMVRVFFLFFSPSRLFPVCRLNYEILPDSNEPIKKKVAKSQYRTFPNVIRAERIGNLYIIDL